MTEDFSLQETIRLTQYSHGSGCGCKISPSVLSEILKNNESIPGYRDLLVGNHSRDDAAVLDLGNGTALISTTDFFMPVVDDPFQFGYIAATNAISDVYAMGGKPILAIAILGWPVGKIDPKVAGKVIEGGRAACEKAGIPLAGGHSIDSPEPIFGLAVNGIVNILHLKKNNTAVENDLLFLTKKIGTGVLTTASKKGILKEADLNNAVHSMSQLNRIGTILGTKNYVHALTDVTGFGLLGHLGEMMEGSRLQAEIEMKNIPVMSSIHDYIAQGCIPGGTNRNWASYGEKISSVSETNRVILSDPQTSGGLLVAVDPGYREEFIHIIQSEGLEKFAAVPIGKVVSGRKFLIEVIE